MVQTDASHQATLQTVLRVLSSNGVRVRQVCVGRAFDPTQCDMVITVGGDGTFLWASHSLSATPILGVNSAPATSTGFFCAASAQTFSERWKQIEQGSLPRSRIARMCVWRGKEVVADRVLNEVLVASRSPAAMTRLGVTLGAEEAHFRSSGIWVGPPAGSSAAMASAGGQPLALTSRTLQWVVREAVGGPSQALARGVLLPKAKLQVRVESRDVRMFVDGGKRPHVLQVGDELRFSESPEPLHAWTPAF